MGISSSFTMNTSLLSPDGGGGGGGGGGSAGVLPARRLAPGANVPPPPWLPKSPSQSSLLLPGMSRVTHCQPAIVCLITNANNITYIQDGNQISGVQREISGIVPGSVLQHVHEKSLH